ncbi:DUF2510 domain-containing protein [Nocardia vermiculata]|uniref:DUF2510 domain-containing protein n=1 Tax=Nocardia vermiculata TaxID=257274 RepID=A0A846Y8K5_9NOCA|nr:DUF2510 domain-containing protein [Nocardia vermiculata]NKY54180.1 DUF2510 domain-containing protein [Nocardia vermiculata]
MNEEPPLDYFAQFAKDHPTGNHTRKPWAIPVVVTIGAIGVLALLGSSGFNEDDIPGMMFLALLLGIPALLFFLVIRALVRVGNKPTPPVMIAPPPAQPMPMPPGWYRDNYGSMRWWDGYQWTQHTQ